jgi:triosephosphate isomerase
MHGDLASARALTVGIREGLPPSLTSDVAICPPAVHLGLAVELLAGSPIAVGAQDVAAEDAGAFTGDVSAAMVRDMGCELAIVGHSERRHGHGETDELVAGKYAAALRNGLTPVLCVGELLDERDEGCTESVIGRQLDAVVAAAGVESFARAVVAYEPVWAIGTGKTASPEQAQAVHSFIRHRLGERDAGIATELRIIYGGSVKAENARELFAMDDVDGGLIGGASLAAGSFLAICEATA